MYLSNKIALVTGASRGIGFAIAEELALQGATVIGTATTLEGAEKITQQFSEKKLPVVGYVLDVAQPQAIAALLTQIEAKYAAPLILINNAGITRDNLLLRMSEEQWLEVMATNFNAIFNLSKQCLKAMLKARWGRIINISSVVGVTGNAGQANYAAAKAGVIGFSKSLAQEIASRNVTVNVVAPGFIDTDMTRALSEAQREAILATIPMQRLGTSQEIAQVVSFLISPAANYITGQTIHVNGGMFMV